MDQLQMAAASYRPTYSLALSALPDAPVVAETVTTSQRTRLSLAAVLRRAADSIAPATPALPC